MIALVLMKTKYLKFPVKISWFVGERDFEERQSIYIVLLYKDFLGKTFYFRMVVESLVLFTLQVKVKVVTKVTVEDVELSVVDKEQNIKAKTLR